MEVTVASNHLQGPHLESLKAMSKLSGYQVEAQLDYQITGPRPKSAGRGPTGLWARGRNRGQLENRNHVVPKTEFQDGGDRTRSFSHKMIILA